MKRKLYVFDGDLLKGPTASLPDSTSKIISDLRRATFEAFYDSNGNRHVFSSELGVAPNSNHETYGNLLQTTHSFTFFRVYDIFKRFYPGVDLDRAIFVSWTDSKTPLELEAHLAIHMLPRNLFGMGVPTYDLDYVAALDLKLSLDSFSKFCHSLIAKLDLSDPFEFQYARELLRVLAYLQKFGSQVDFSSIPNIICIDPASGFIPTEFEFLERSTFHSDLTNRGKPALYLS